MLSTLPRTCPTVRLSPSAMACRAAITSPISSLTRHWMDWLMSPWAMALVRSRARPRRVVMEMLMLRMTNHSKAAAAKQMGR